MSAGVLMQKSKAFAIRIIRFARFLQDEKKERIISKQIFRSGTSIGANIRESNNAQSKADFVNKLSIALKEADETAYWLELLVESDTIEQIQFDSLYDDLKEVIALLTSSIKTAKNKGFLPAITTNGSLLSKKGDELLKNLPHKISISLHAPEANEAFSDEGYLKSCINFAKEASKKGCIVALRLWNLGSGADNSSILDFLHREFSGEWVDIRGGSSHRLADMIFLEWGKRFEWPDPSLPECDTDCDIFCYGLRDQIGILCDGTVVPCCLDADANLSLGNLFNSDLDEILSSDKAKNIYNGFTRRRAVESLCRKCGYAKRFSK